MTSICIEVGSHDGYDTRRIYNQYRTTLFGFEPHPHFYEVACNATRDLASEVKIFQCAVSDRDLPEISLNESRSGGTHSILPFKSDADLETTWINRDDVKFSGRTYKVPCTRLDTFLDQQGFNPDTLSIMHLHIDAQGVDLEVLKSLGRYLSCVKSGVLETAACESSSIYVGQVNTVITTQKFLRDNNFDLELEANDYSGVSSAPYEYNVRFIQNPNFSRDIIQGSLGIIDPTKKWKYAVILQGPYHSHTQNSVRMFLERNDPASVLVIVCTYLPLEDQPMGTFLSPYEKSIVIDQEGPYVGRLIYQFVKLPSRTEYPEFWATNMEKNQNCQRLSTYAGLRLAENLSIPFVLKCRTDSFLGLPNVCDTLLQDYINKYPLLIHPEDEACREKIKGRIVTCDHNARNSEHEYISDFWYFGWTSDIMNLFTMKPGSAWNEGVGMSTGGNPEQNLIDCWKREVGIKKNYGASIVELAARYFAVACSIKMEFLWQERCHNFDRYITEGKPYLEQVHYGHYYHNTRYHEYQWVKDVVEFQRNEKLNEE